MIPDFSIFTLITSIFICIIAYYLGLSLIEGIREYRRKRRKSEKKK